MDTDAVRKMAGVFDDMSNVLKAVSMALEAAMMILKVSAFVGLVGGIAVERYLANIKPKVDKLGAKCAEMNQDLNKAAALHEQSSQTGDSI
jgi:hypothetical protein